MSDQSGGPGWWQATDGKWYPPQMHPGYEQLRRQVSAEAPTIEGLPGADAAPSRRWGGYSASSTKSLGRTDSVMSAREWVLIVRIVIGLMLFVVGFLSTRSMFSDSSEPVSSRSTSPRRTPTTDPYANAGPSATWSVTSTTLAPLPAGSCTATPADLARLGAVPAAPAGTAADVEAARVHLTPNPAWGPAKGRGSAWTLSQPVDHTVTVDADVTSKASTVEQYVAVLREEIEGDDGRVLKTTQVLSSASRVLSAVDYEYVNGVDEAPERYRTWVDVCEGRVALLSVTAGPADFDAAAAAVEPYARTIQAR